jgi:hypothetical protein
VLLAVFLVNVVYEMKKMQTRTPTNGIEKKRKTRKGMKKTRVKMGWEKAKKEEVNEEEGIISVFVCESSCQLDRN